MLNDSIQKISLALACILSIVMFLSCHRQNNNPIRNNSQPLWQLVWQDEFNGVHLDGGRWNYEIGGGGWGNNELEYYTDREDNVYVQDGQLVIEARREHYENREYTSARITTNSKGDWLYGKIEVRAKLPVGKGLWPAIWLLPTDWAYGSWAASGEIDIMELVGNNPFQVFGSIHFGGEFPHNVYKNGNFVLRDGSDFSDDFHVFSLIWEPADLRWYVDGKLYEEQSEWYSNNGDFPAPFDKRFHLLLNVAVGGNWPGSPDASTEFPQRMYVDYVRVYSYKGERPSISITSPTEGQVFSRGSTIPITVKTSAGSGEVVQVKYYTQTEKIGQAMVSPFGILWPNVSEGEYRLLAGAEDDSAHYALSPPVTIEVK